MIRKIVLLLYIVVVVIMATATIVERCEDTDYVRQNIYGAWWFTLVWTSLTVMGVFWFLRQRVRRPSTAMLHASFVIILTGALITHLWAEKGKMHLRCNETVNSYVDENNHERQLPFQLTLDTFYVSYHQGTLSEIDYTSIITITDDNERKQFHVSMNNICSYRGVRFCQSGYDEDQLGTVISVNKDSLGVSITYIGYALLFISLIWMLLDPKGTYRQLLRSPLIRRGIALYIIVVSASQANAANTTNGTPTLPDSVAVRLGKLYIQYNGRICPFETFSIDVAKKLCGAENYNGLSALQIVSGLIFWGDKWQDEPIINIKKRLIRERLGLPKRCSVNDFFSPSTGDYVLERLVANYYSGDRSELNKQAVMLDEKIMLIMSIRTGRPLKLFPYTDSMCTTTWYAPTDRLPGHIDPEHHKYITEVFGLLNLQISEEHYDMVNAFLDKMLLYQKTFGHTSVPSHLKTTAEHVYNKFSPTRITFITCLVMGLLTLFLSVFSLTGKENLRYTNAISLVVLLAVFMCLSANMALIWIITGHVPMSNGYETMQLMAWIIMLIALLAYRRSFLLVTFAFILSGFFLLVAHLAQMEPQMSHLMPVLRSPLLSLHVSVIMVSFALLSFTFVISLSYLVVCVLDKDDKRDRLKKLTLLSKLFLYPAIVTLSFGIFIGAIWANISWGAYWSWDPKEVWALITLMAYALPLHSRSLPIFGNARFYHIYVTLAFLTMLMTYFGVNFFLGGMHSYA